MLSAADIFLSTIALTNAVQNTNTTMYTKTALAQHMYVNLVHNTFLDTNGHMFAVTQNAAHHAQNIFQIVIQAATNIRSHYAKSRTFEFST